MKLNIIETDAGYFIEIKSEKYHYQREKILINDKPLGYTWKNNWYFVDSFPVKVELPLAPKKELVNYRLKDGYPTSEKTPVVVDVDYFSFDDDDIQSHSEVRNLYEPVYIETELPNEVIEFETEIVAKIKDIVELKDIKLEGFERRGWNDQVVVYNSDSFNHSIFDELLFHKDVLPLRPCMLNSEQFYSILRNHVKNNIDSKYAEITSDYDFCLTVKKKIKLNVPKEYKVDINLAHNLFSKRKRKPKYESREQKYELIQAFEIAPDVKGRGVYRDYTRCPEVVAANANELELKVKHMLDDLMRFINRPLVQCPHCLGAGAVDEGTYKFKEVKND